MHRSKFDPICSVNEISLGLLRKAHTLTRRYNGARALLKDVYDLTWMHDLKLQLYFSNFADQNWWFTLMNNR